MKRFIVWLASAGFSGYSPFAPGTAGTIVGVLVYILFSFFPTPLYILSTVTAFFLGWWASERAEVIFGEKDCSIITIDEVIGYLVTMAFLPRTIPVMVGGFVVFRIFDIIKPPPVRAIHSRMKGGLAIVLDDVAAGVYSNLLLQLIIRWPGHVLLNAGNLFFGS